MIVSIESLSPKIERILDKLNLVNICRYQSDIDKNSNLEILSNELNGYDINQTNVYYQNLYGIRNINNLSKEDKITFKEVYDSKEIKIDYIIYFYTTWDQLNEYHDNNNIRRLYSEYEWYFDFMVCEIPIFKINLDDSDEMIIRNFYHVNNKLCMINSSK